MKLGRHGPADIGEMKDYERRLFALVRAAFGPCPASTIIKRVRCSWNKSESASINSLGGASAIAPRIRSAIAVGSWSARTKVLWFSPIAKLQR
jgi:hypothetical protein